MYANLCLFAATFKNKKDAKAHKHIIFCMFSVKHEN
jgi:hypothetical protein